MIVYNTLRMKELIRMHVEKATNLDKVFIGMLACFEMLRKRNPLEHRLGYVAGIITSDGPDHTMRNIEKLAEYTHKLRIALGFPVFSATDIFSVALFAKLQEMGLPPSEREAQFIDFWRRILTSGHVTDILMTPRWEVSAGATDEHKTAMDRGIQVHYVSDLLEIISAPLNLEKE